ncbi:alkaline phosphatase PhoX [Haladaptatus sp. NG-WS-4]
MREHLSRRTTLESLIALSFGVHAGTAGASSGRVAGHEAHGNEPTLNRFATTVAGAEFTGLFLTDDGQLFFNVQHPGADADEQYRPGAIGAVTGVDMTRLPRDFESVQPPATPARYVETADGSYQMLAEGGDETVDGERLGVPYSKSGEPLTDGANPDFNGFVADDDGADSGYLFTNWETQPGMVSRLTLQQSSDTGSWTVTEKRNLDFRPVEGTWNNCFGTVSPWGTPLTSEEYEPDARAWFSSEETTYGNGEQSVEEYLGYFGNAYRYGYIVEIESPTGEPEPTKHYAMGRFSHENAVVMPDRKTVYMSDDGTGTVFFKFVADEPGDLSAGTLYAARAKQQGPVGDAAEVSFELEWLELAHATDEEVLSWIETYDDQAPSTNPNYVTDAEVEAWANGEADDDRAAFLESRKAAAAIGATDEFRKMEGVNVKSDARPGDFLYMAMSEVNETMLPNAATEEHDDPQDDIALEGNDYGAVYRMRLDGRYDVHRMEPAIVGGPNANVCGGCPYDSHPNSKQTVCRDCSFNPTTDHDSTDSSSTDAKGVQKATETGKELAGGGLRKLTDASTTVDPENTIANPDNLVVLPDGRVVVGEDSGLHEPNMLWVYDPGR